jgi:Ca2+-binding EF-hand superfamily protein
MTEQGERMHFEKLDKTADKYLTPDELPTDHELYLGFATYDFNTDGRLSEKELGEYLKTIPE